MALILGVLCAGNRSFAGNRIPLDRDTRLKISLGAARGMAHIHSQGGEKFVDGNVKATNVLLSVDLEPSVGDFGLALLMNFPAVPPSRAFPGYRAPETMEMRKFMQKSDVYSFGVLLLEMLTGKSPLPPDLYQVCWTLRSSLLSLFVKRYRVAIFNIFLFHTRCSSKVSGCHF